MEALLNAFSVCFWARKLRSNGVCGPHVISYEGDGFANEIVVSDEMGCNIIFGSNVDLSENFKVTPGAWYHYCSCWSLSSGTQSVYLNGQLVSSRATPSGRTLRNGGFLAIGNDAGSEGKGMSSSFKFGGELYKLNFFSKELSSTEVQEMARHKCSTAEETYGDLRSIKWEDILLMRRSGVVTDIRTECRIVGRYILCKYAYQQNNFGISPHVSCISPRAPARGG